MSRIEIVFFLQCKPLELSLALSVRVRVRFRSRVMVRSG